MIQEEIKGYIRGIPEARKKGAVFWQLKEIVRIVFLEILGGIKNVWGSKITR